LNFHPAEEAGAAVAETFFVIEIDEAYARLRQHPNIRSPRPALDLDIEGVKSCGLPVGDVPLDGRNLKHTVKGRLASGSFFR
jgi:hypothetical protein